MNLDNVIKLRYFGYTQLPIFCWIKSVLTQLDYLLSGAVGGRIRPLWIHNVVATQATREVILRLGQRDDIAYINYDRPVGEEDPGGRGGGEAPALRGGPPGPGRSQSAVERTTQHGEDDPHFQPYPHRVGRLLHVDRDH